MTVHLDRDFNSGPLTHGDNDDEDGEYADHRVHAVSEGRDDDSQRPQLPKYLCVCGWVGARARERGAVRSWFLCKCMYLMN